MGYFQLKQIEGLARIAGHMDDDPVVVPPTRWGPASWWRIGLVALLVLIVVLAVMRWS